MSLTEVEVEGGGWGTRGKVCEGACQLSDMEENVGTSGIWLLIIPDVPTFPSNGVSTYLLWSSCDSMSLTGMPRPLDDDYEVPQGQPLGTNLEAI